MTTATPPIDKNSDLPSTGSIPMSDATEAIVCNAEPLTPPLRPRGEWSLEDLRRHLQWAVNVEHYTILYYMSAWFSIKDQGNEAARLVKSVVNQEMLHMQSAANLYNSFAFEEKLVLDTPLYGVGIPHLNFSLNQVDPTSMFSPYSTEIGPFDMRRLNTMCLIEYPKWFVEADKSGVVGLEAAPEDQQYGSIGELYAAVRKQVIEFARHIVPNRNQRNLFDHFYPKAELEVTEQGGAGRQQAKGLIELVVSQGEGKDRKQDSVPTKYQNLADDPQPAADHFEKFNYLRGQALPDTWRLTIGNPAARTAQAALLDHYAQLLNYMRVLFDATGPGGGPNQKVPEGGFGPVMFKVGAAITACWQAGALPVFSFAKQTTLTSKDEG